VTTLFVSPRRIPKLGAFIEPATLLKRSTTCQATPGANGPSWPTFIAETKDSLWRLVRFRCESILLRSHWVLVVMDVFTHRIVVLASSVPTMRASPYVGCSITLLLAGPYRNTSPTH
jgi:hypothetical protein